MSALEEIDSEIQSLPQQEVSGTVFEIKILRSELLRALNSTLSAVPTRDILAQLKNYHLKLIGSTLRVTASDSIYTLRDSAEVLSGTASKAVLLPGAQFRDIVSECTEEVLIRVSAKSGKYFAGIRSGTAKWGLPLIPPEGFPEFDEIDEVPMYPYSSEALSSGLRSVKAAISDSGMNPGLAVVDISNGNIRASDLSRFHQVEKTGFPQDCRISQRAIRELSGWKGEASVGQTDRALSFKQGSLNLVVQKVIHPFPDIDELLLLPVMSHEYGFTVHRKSLMKAIRKVRLVSDENTCAVALSLNEGSVSVQSRNGHGGVAVENLESDWSLAPRHLYFDHTHLSDLLLAAESEEVTLRLGKDLAQKASPLLLVDGNYKAVIGQIRQDWTWNV